MINILKIFIIIVIYICATFTEVFSAVKTDDELAKTIESFAIPETPAFSVLGVTPDKIIRPNNGRELVISVLNGLDENGNPQNGLAVDFSPYLLFYGNKITLADYKKNSLERFLSHVQVSLATSKGAEDSDKSIRAAAGIRATIFNFGDPRMDSTLDSCIAGAHQRALDQYPPIPPSTTELEYALIAKSIEQSVEQEVKICRDNSIKNNIGKPSLDIGLSPIWFSEDGQTKNMEWSGVAAWSAFKIGTDNLLLIANAQYKSNGHEPDAATFDQFIEGQIFSTGAKIRSGNAANGLLVQVVYTRYNPKGGDWDDQFLYSVGAEIKLADNLWLEGSVGGTSGKDGRDSGFVTSQFKWGISETAILK